jgi:hypothetical protein
MPYKLDPENPLRWPDSFHELYFEFKRQQEEAMKIALLFIQDINEEYSSVSQKRR